MSLLEETRERFKDDVYATETTGIVIEDVATNYAKCSLKISPKHLNANNQVMGGAIFTLADFTFAVASNTNNPLTVSINSNINFLGTCKGDTLFSETTLIKYGRTTCMFDIKIYDNLNNLVAKASVTGFKQL